jgi:hypothetical protein
MTRVTLLAALGALALSFTAIAGAHDRSNEMTSPRAVLLEPTGSATGAHMEPGAPSSAMLDGSSLSESTMTASSVSDVDHVLCATAEGTCEEPEVPRLAEPMARAILKRSGIGWSEPTRRQLTSRPGHDIRLAMAVRATGIRLNC